MSYSEFPHTNYSDRDSMELIILYKQLVNNYEGTLHQIEEVRNRLDEYQKTMDSVIDVKVRDRVNTQVNAALNEIRSDIAYLEKLLNALQTQTEKDSGNIWKELSNVSFRIEEVSLKVDTVKTDLLKQIQSVNKELSTKIDTTNRELTQKITVETARVLAESVAYTANQIAALDDDLSKKIAEIEKASGHKAIKWLWQYGCYHGGFTAEEWYYLTKITAEEFNRSNITADEWYVDATRIFKQFDESDYVFSPVTGVWMHIKDAFYELATAIKIGAITAKEYDDLKMTASEYENFKLGAEQYDWNGKEKLCTARKQNC